jgi:hypothetical protein
MTRKEHVDVLIAAAVNPELIGRSRRFGRKAWVVDDFPADPFKEFGKMWQLCLEKWIDDRPVWFFISYIQTTPEVKLAAYTGLLGNTDMGLKGLRQEVIRTCDPLEDAKVLKLAWDDPDEGCRKTARERVGRFTDYVGVKTEES